MSTSPLLGRGEERPALRAVRRHNEFALGSVAKVDNRSEHLGITSPALRIITVSPMSTPLRLTSEAFVQGSHPDGGPGDAHRGHECERCHASGAADVDPDVEQPGLGSSGGYLYAAAHRGARLVAPSRRVGRSLDLDYDAVDLMLDLMPTLTPVLDALAYRGQTGHPGGCSETGNPQAFSAR